MSKLNKIQKTVYGGDTKFEKLFLIILFCPVSFCIVYVCLYFLPIMIPFYNEQGEVLKALVVGFFLIFFLIFFMVIGILGLRALYELIKSKDIAQSHTPPKEKKDEQTEN